MSESVATSIGNSSLPRNESLWALTERTLSLGLGAAAVVVSYITKAAWSTIASTNGWILFFLVAKPLVDLTWRWQLLRFSEQDINLQAVVGSLIVVCGLARIWHLRKETPLPRLGALLLICSALSVLYSPSAMGLNELIRLYSGFVFLFIGGEALCRRERFDWFAKVFVGVVSVPVLLAFMQVAGLLPFDYWDWIEGQQIGRASGTYNTPLGLVYLFMYSVPLALYLLERTNSWLLRLSVGASLLALGLTYHRTGYIAIAAQVVLWLLLKKKFAVALSLCAVACLAAALYAGAVRALYEPLTAAVQGDVDVSSDQFLRGRGLIWATYLADYAQGTPVHWMIGRGGSVLHGSLFLDEMGENDPHNDFVRLLHDYGIVGMVLYIWLLWRLAVSGWRGLRSGPFPDGVGRVLLVSLLAVLILSTTGEPTRYPSAILYLCSLGSVAIVLERSSQVQEPESS